MNEPESYEEVHCKERNFWKKAMDSEINSLTENNTWILKPLPQKGKTLSCKWVFCIKKNTAGTVEKHKERLVIKGLNQKQGIYCKQIFSPVTKLSTVWSVISITASENMYLQFGVLSV